jgi:hypothetical protein
MLPELAKKSIRKMKIYGKIDATGLQRSTWMKWIELAASLSDYEVDQKRDIGRCSFGSLR